MVHIWIFIHQPVRFGPAKILVDPIHVAILSFILLILIRFNFLLGSVMCQGGMTWNDLGQPKPLQLCNHSFGDAVGCKLDPMVPMCWVEAS